MAELENVTLEGKPLHSLRVADLKAALEQRGLAKSGQKNALIKRLKGALMLENLQRTSIHQIGLQPNSQIGEEMSQNSFIKQYLAKQQELLRQRLEREAREATEADGSDIGESPANIHPSHWSSVQLSKTQSPAGPKENDHTLTKESTSCLPDKHHIVHSYLSVTQAEAGGVDHGGGLPQNPDLMGSYRLDMGSAPLAQESPDTKAGKIRHSSFFPSHEEVATTPSPPRAVASLSVRVIGQPEHQGLPLMMPHPQEKKGTAPIEASTAHSVLQLSCSARAAAYVQVDSDDDDDSDDNVEWGPSSHSKKNVRTTSVQPPPAAAPQQSRRKLQPPQYIPPQPQPVHQPSLQLRQPTPPPSPPPELSFPLPDTPKQSPHYQYEPVGLGEGAAPGPGIMPSPPPLKRQDSSSSSRSSSPEPPSTRRPGPLSLLVCKMESEGMFDGGQKVGMEKGVMEIAEQEDSKAAKAPKVRMLSKGSVVHTKQQNQPLRPQVSVAVLTVLSTQQDAPDSDLESNSGEQKRGEEKENENVDETSAPFLRTSSTTVPLKKPQMFSEVPSPESLKSPSKPEQVSVVITWPKCTEDVAMETEVSTAMPESKQSEEDKEIKGLEKQPPLQSPRVTEDSPKPPSSHPSSEEGDIEETKDHSLRENTHESQSSSGQSSFCRSSSSPSQHKSRPHSQEDKEKENRRSHIEEKKGQSPREIKQEAASEPAGQVAMELEGRSDSESAVRQSDHQRAGSNDSQQEESSAAKHFAARKISLSIKMENASAESESVGGASRKRRWGSSTAVTAKKPSISITTESLKTLITEIKPLQEAVVELHPDEGRLTGEEDLTGPHDLDEPEEDEGFKIRRTVTQIVPSDGHENGERKIKEDDKEKPEEKKEKPRKRKPSSDATIKTQEGDAIKVTPNDSLVWRSITQQKSGVSVTIDDPIRTGRELSPHGKTSNILHICNLVRPFTLVQLKELLNRTGTLVEEGFWIDKIKSHCFVTYSTTEEAVTTRETLHGVKWPASNPKVLRVDFCEQEELDFHKGLLSNDHAGEGHDTQASGTLIHPAAPPPLLPTHRAKENEREKGRDGGDSAVRDLWAEREKAMERRESTRSEREWDRDKVKDFGREDRERTKRSRDRRRRERGQSKEKRTKKDKQEEPPAKLLDDLFCKTKAAPCIYWLPLTEEQVTQRALERADRIKEREKRRKELQEEEDKKREEQRERAKGRDREAGATGGGRGGGVVGRSADGERDEGKERERERGREGEKTRDSQRGHGCSDSKTTGGSRRLQSRSNTSRDRHR